MKDYLIIGQAPPAVKQSLPYDTTMLYEMLSWCGIRKDQAQDIFDFDAMTDKFPGFGKSGHKPPSLIEMRQHYDNCLYWKIESSKGVIVLGNVAKEALIKFGFDHTNSAFIIHPSRRNYARIMKDQGRITNVIKQVIGGQP
jgi:hypothetical protein